MPICITQRDYCPLFTNPRPGKNKKSFTLFELLIVLIILGILAAIAYPAYQGAVWRARFTEVFNTIGAFARAEHVYYLEYGTYTNIADFSQCYAGNGVAAGSTLIQQQLNVVIPSTHVFTYVIEPGGGQSTTGIFFRQPGYSWCYWYNYVTKIWYPYGNPYDSATYGPACKYFQPPP
ncbi:MAG: prepilin-type N-terminal cleavage/methylation domain-containing protein [Candidatus Omnitrophica bacterium]|nr:prepilin-type N-terminal cleavage/methylation domain-containing protein [Candidatus Omnitrophota bacterium]